MNTESYTLRERGGCLTIWLIFALIASAYSFF